MTGGLDDGNADSFEISNSFEIIISETGPAEKLGDDLTALCRRAAHVALERNRERPAGPAATGVGGFPVEVGLTFVDDLRIRELNHRYLGRDEPTDVLAFGLGDDLPDGSGLPPGTDPPPGATLPLGDVVVSVERAASQAREYRRPFPEELARLVAHGTLHLLGYVDETETEAAEMRTREDAVLTELGFAPGSPGKEE